jgi:hypothetical protein
MSKKDPGSGLLADILAEASWVMRLTIVTGLLAGLGAAGLLCWTWLPAPEPGFRRAYVMTVIFIFFGGLVVGLLGGLLAGTLLELALAPFVTLLRPPNQRRRRRRDADWDD